jgi:hypothetical protein
MYSKELVDSVVMELEKYASDSQVSELENLAKIAVFQDSLKRKRAAQATDSQRPDLASTLAASVALGK